MLFFDDGLEDNHLARVEGGERRRRRVEWGVKTRWRSLRASGQVGVEKARERLKEWAEINSRNS